MAKSKRAFLLFFCCGAFNTEESLAKNSSSPYLQAFFV